MTCPRCGRGPMRAIYGEFYLYAQPSDYQCLSCYGLASEMGGDALIEEIRRAERAPEPGQV